MTAFTASHPGARHRIRFKNTCNRLFGIHARLDRPLGSHCTPPQVPLQHVNLFTAGNDQKENWQPRHCCMLNRSLGGAANDCQGSGRLMTVYGMEGTAVLPIPHQTTGHSIVRTDCSLSAPDLTSIEVNCIMKKWKFAKLPMNQPTSRCCEKMVFRMGALNSKNPCKSVTDIL